MSVHERPADGERSRAIARTLRALRERTRPGRPDTPDHSPRGKRRRATRFRIAAFCAAHRRRRGTKARPCQTSMIRKAAVSAIREASRPRGGLRRNFNSRRAKRTYVAQVCLTVRSLLLPPFPHPSHTPSRRCN
jgi:hypothetical protein